MVKYFLWSIMLTMCVLAFHVNLGIAERVYFIEREWVKVWINQDGSIDLFYNITLTLVSGDSINYVFVGQPNGYFTIINAYDQYGNFLTATSASSGSDYKVRVNLASPLNAGENIWFTLSTRVTRMIYEDKTNVGNVGMVFIPCWWPVDVKDLRIMVVLPPSVNASIVKTTKVYYNGTTYEGNRLAIFWEKQNLSPNEQYPIGVSFPKEYVQSYEPLNPTLTPYIGPFLVCIGTIFIVCILVVVSSKRQYSTPSICMETLGVKRGLTAVEASYLLGLDPTRIVAEILFGLLQKEVVWVEAVKPAIKLRIMPQFQNPQRRRELLRYYEAEFLDAVKADGTLDEVKLAEVVMNIRDVVEDKMRGYCRRDTINYYEKIVENAWKQVEQAGAPDWASKIYNEQLLWLLLDENVKSRTQTVFSERKFEPSSQWLWYWYIYKYYHPDSAAKIPNHKAEPPAIPGADFANTIATALENTANNIVLNIEKFVNAIVPMPKAADQPVQHEVSCVCACAACACACACVSCACACASGGVG